MECINGDCHDPLCKQIGCLSQPAYHFRRLLKHASVHQGAAVIASTKTTDDPDVFGEMLRNHVFVEEKGCYSCFDLVEGFTEVDKGSELGKKLLVALGWDEKYECTQEIYDTSVIYSDGHIHVAWHWDGDGHLILVEDNKAAENTDCKKSFGWEWIDWVK